MDKSKANKFKKLILERTTQKIFHRLYILPKCKTKQGNPVDYKYFNMQLNGHTTMLKEVEEAVEKYIKDMN